MDNQSGIEKVAAVMDALGALTWRDLAETRLITLAGSLLAEWDAFVAKKPPYDSPLQSRDVERQPLVAWVDFINRIKSNNDNAGSRIRTVKALRREGVESWEKLLDKECDPYYWKNFGPVSFRLLSKVMKECGISPPNHWTFT